MNLDNVEDFLEGNISYYMNMMGMYPEFLREQVRYRMSKCGDCIKENKCRYCSCPARKKVFAGRSCNKGERFPDLMTKDKWDEYKRENNIK